MSVIQDNIITSNNIQPASGQSLTIKDEGGTASITVATNGEATFAENIKVTANKGIDFSAQTATSASGASTTSEVLDHYEEGTWTPTGTNVDGTSIGVFVKIGSMVFIQSWIKASGGDTTSAFGGLPFTADSGVGNAQGGGNSAYQNRDTVGLRQMGFLVSGTSFTMFDGRNTVVLGNGEQMHLQLFYRAT